VLDKYRLNPFSIEIYKDLVGDLDADAPKKLMMRIIDYVATEISLCSKTTPTVKFNPVFVDATKRETKRNPSRYLIDIGFWAKTETKHWYMVNPSQLELPLANKYSLIARYNQNEGKQMPFPKKFLSRNKCYEEKKTVERKRSKGYKPVEICGAVFVPNNIAEEERLKTIKATSDTAIGRLEAKIDFLIKRMTPEEKKEAERHLTLVQDD